MITYVLLFFEGILAFISPCILPLIPLYIVYLTGQTTKEKNNLVVNTLCFILGFTLVFVGLGASAVVFGSLFKDNRLLIQQISGVVIILMGLNYMEILRLPSVNIGKKIDVNLSKLRPVSSLFFGISFSFCWTACLSSLLGSAFMLASNKSTVYEGMLMLFTFSMGLAIPFFITAMIMNKLTKAFDFIKKHYRIIKIGSGILLIVVGLALLFDVFGYWAGLFN